MRVNPNYKPDDAYFEYDKGIADAIAETLAAGHELSPTVTSLFNQMMYWKQQADLSEQNVALVRACARLKDENAQALERIEALETQVDRLKTLADKYLSYRRAWRSAYRLEDEE